VVGHRKEDAISPHFSRLDALPISPEYDMDVS